MKTTKKFLALLLSAILLCSFGVGANAAAPEDMTPEELEAQVAYAAPQVLTPSEVEAYGRALLMQAMEDLRGDYTISGDLYEGTFRDPDRYDYEKVFHSNGKYTFLRYEGFYHVRHGNSGTMDWFASYYDIVINNDIVRVYPDQGAYRRLNASPSADYIPMLEPKSITESTPIEILGYNDTETGKSVQISFDGYTYRFWKDSLHYIAMANRSYIIIDFLDKAVSQDVFSIDGYRRASNLQAWCWENAQAVREYFSKNSWPPYYLPFLLWWIVFLPLQTISFAFNRTFIR